MRAFSQADGSICSCRGQDEFSHQDPGKFCIACFFPCFTRGNIAQLRGDSYDEACLSSCALELLTHWTMLGLCFSAIYDSIVTRPRILHGDEYPRPHDGGFLSGCHSGDPHDVDPVCDCAKYLFCRPCALARDERLAILGAQENTIEHSIQTQPSA